MSKILSLRMTPWWALIVCVSIVKASYSRSSSVTCNDIDAEIKSYQPVVDRIIASVRDGGHFQSHTYSTLASFVDKFGPRMTGSSALERSIDYMVKESQDFGLNVWTENVTAPKWER